ncbi:hypothetical protein NH340_JMT05475 [Sarcoptes scabiei]|nr:hypothetical protein NH340_JMT05475 [Sarcoptes scabiei]
MFSMSSVWSVRNFIRTFSFSVPLALVFFDNIGYVARVEGISMQPTLNPDNRFDELTKSNSSLDIKCLLEDFLNSSDLILLSHWATRNYQIQRGDIVSLVSPKNPKQIIIKRIIALEGDTIVSRGNLRYQTIKIPKGHCWIEGDNSSKSLDSNIFGPVAVGLITAQAKYVIWPPKRWKSLSLKLPTDRTFSPISTSIYNGSYSAGRSMLIELNEE